MPGPAPRPAGLRLIEGRSPGRDSGGRPVAPARAFARLPPSAPTWLPREAAAEWRRVVPELARLQLIKQPDRAALTAYCLCWARLVEAQRILKDEGLLHTNSQGVTRHPAVAIAEAASKELRAWCREFGLTPSAESAVGTQEADSGEDDNPF